MIQASPIDADVLSERQRQLAEDLCSLMSVRWGRRLAQWLIYEVGHMNESSFFASPAGHSVASIKEGRAAEAHRDYHEGLRGMAITIYQAISEVAVEKLVEMNNEHLLEVQAYRARRHPSNAGDDPA